MSILASLALVVPFAQDPQPTPAPEDPPVESRTGSVGPSLRFGQLRHVQLLEPRDEVLRFATQVELGHMRNASWPEGTDTAIAVFEGDAGKPVAELAVGASLIRHATWDTRPLWRLVELKGVQRLVVLEPQRIQDGVVLSGGVLRVLAFPEGTELLKLDGVQEIEDVRTVEGRADVLLRQGTSMRWVRVDARGAAVAPDPVPTGFDSVHAATFVRGHGQTEDPIWVVGRQQDRIRAIPVTPEGARPELGVDVAFDVTNHSTQDPTLWRSYRAAAWQSVDSTYLAVAWPRYRSGVGVVQVIEIGSPPRRLWRGRPDPEVRGDSLDQMEYGQSIAFVPDVDEDGAPDLVVTGPWCFETRVDLLSGRTGTPIHRWTPGAFLSAGHSLSVSGDGTRLLVGGTESRSYPENLAHEGQAHLLDGRTWKRIRGWQKSMRER